MRELESLNELTHRPGDRPAVESQLSEDWISARNRRVTSASNLPTRLNHRQDAGLDPLGQSGPGGHDFGQVGTNLTSLIRHIIATKVRTKRRGIRVSPP
jgi:hypothetical protein